MKRQRTSDYVDTVATIYTSIGSFSLYTAVSSNEPLAVTILPASVSEVSVQLTNPTGAPFVGYLKIITQ